MAPPKNDDAPQSGTGRRRRTSIDKIPDLQARRICFSKRRQGLFRKCMEFGRLFPGYEIAAVAFSPDVGTPFEFASSSASSAEIFRRLLEDRAPPPVVTRALDLDAHNSSSSGLHDARIQTLMAEEEQAVEFQEAAADLCGGDNFPDANDGVDPSDLSWADSVILDLDDRSRG